MYWLTRCPLCAQGRLFFFVNTNANRIYLHCEECEWGWDDLADIRVASGFLTLQQEFDARPAERHEIEQAGYWESAKAA